jgi:hypothetical protein
MRDRGCTDRRTEPRTNAVMERWVQTCRRELLVAGTSATCSMPLRDFEEFCNEHRPHQGIADTRPRYSYRHRSSITVRGLSVRWCVDDTRHRGGRWRRLGDGGGDLPDQVLARTNRCSSLRPCSSSREGPGRADSVEVRKGCGRIANPDGTNLGSSAARSSKAYGRQKSPGWSLESVEVTLQRYGLALLGYSTRRRGIVSYKGWVE